MIGPLPVITNSIPIPLSMPNPARTDHFLCQPDSQQLSDGRAIHYSPSLISFLSCRTQMNVSLLRHGRQHAVSRHFPPHYPFHDVLTIVDFFFFAVAFWRSFGFHSYSRNSLSFCYCSVAGKTSCCTCVLCLSIERDVIRSGADYTVLHTIICRRLRPQKKKK